MEEKNGRVFVVLVLLIGFSLYGTREKVGYRERYAPIEKKMMKSDGIRTDSLNSTLVGGWFSGPCWAVFTEDTLAYIGAGGYLKILNVRDPSNPVLLGKVRTPSVIVDIYLQDTLAYVADGNDGLRIINVSDPTSPDEIGYYDTGGCAYSVYVQNALAYVADGYDGLRIINVSDPTSPDEIGYYDTGSSARGVYVKNTLAYVADGSDGLYIIRYTGGAGVEEAFGIELGVSVVNVFSEIRINYTLKEKKSVKIEIYNVLGQKISSPVNTIQSSGRYSLRWNGKPGVYFVRIVIGDKVYKEKTILIK